MKLKASAPGKLMLSGEYAVLGKAPALVTAVNVRAVAEFTPASDGVLRIVSRPDIHHGGVVAFTADGLQWQSDVVEIFAATFAALDGHQRQKLVGIGGTLVIDTQSFHIKERKLGLGSSAAVIAVLLGIFWRLGDGLPEAGPAFQQALRAQQLFQGSGSGADIAAALSGGTILYRRDPFIAAPVSLPEQLDITPIWTGVAANTGDFIRRMMAFQQQNPEAFLERFKLLEHEAEEVALAVAQGDAALAMEALRDFGAAMKALGDAADMPIWSDVHRAVASLVEHPMVAYKPSGAGGGDIGLLIALGAGDADPLDAVKSRVAGAGYIELPLKFGARGLLVEEL